MRRSRLAIGSAVVLIAASSLVASTASASPATGDPTVATAAPPGDLATHPGPFVSTLAGPMRARSDGIALKTHQDTTVRNFFLTYPPGSGSGWHTHPGLVIATVISGSVVRHLPCQPAQTFTTGQAFVESGAHLVENDGTVPATLVITQIVRADASAPYRDEVPVPTCRPHHHRS